MLVAGAGTAGAVGGAVAPLQCAGSAAAGVEGLTSPQTSANSPCKAQGLLIGCSFSYSQLVVSRELVEGGPGE